MTTPTAAQLATFNETFGNDQAANAYARRMECDSVAALVPMLSRERAREMWWEAHSEDCGRCREEN